MLDSLPDPLPTCRRLNFRKVRNVNQLRFSLLTALILLAPSRLPAQLPALQSPQFGQPIVCNDGAITFSVARAHRHAKDVLFGGGKWEIWGWFNVDAGKCAEIGAGALFEPGGFFGSGDSVTLLAFSFFDSKGVWRGVKVQPGESGSFYPIYPSNQQICVSSGEFRYEREGLEQKDLARVCDRASGGFTLIPASFMYNGSYRDPRSYVFSSPPDGRDYLHVRIGTDGRAVSSGQASGVVNPTSGDSSTGLCGKISCWDLFLQRLNEAAAQQSTANRNNNPPPQRASVNPPPPPPRPAAPPPDDDDPIGNGGFITAPNRPSPAPDPAMSLKWVTADIPAYVEASKIGFEAYKKGEALLSQGYRMWDSNVKPAPAKGCWVVQGATSTTLSCLLLEQADLDRLRSYYAELNRDIAATLPLDWSVQAGPPFGGDLPNQGYRSSSGAHLEVWLARAAAGSVYEIHFQLISAH
jgi:hypothetical protein